MKIEVDPDKNWAKLVDELLKTFVKPRLIQPTFLIDYPVSMSPLAKTKPGEERVVERFQALAAGWRLPTPIPSLMTPLNRGSASPSSDRSARELMRRGGLLTRTT